VGAREDLWDKERAAQSPDYARKRGATQVGDKNRVCHGGNSMRRRRSASNEKGGENGCGQGTTQSSHNKRSTHKRKAFETGNPYMEGKGGTAQRDVEKGGLPPVRPKSSGRIGKKLGIVKKPLARDSCKKRASFKRLD